MLSLVEDWRLSGLTQKAFCALHGLKVATLGYWVARSREKEDRAGGFIALERGSPHREVEIIFPNGVRVLLEGDPGMVSRLIRLY